MLKTWPVFLKDFLLNRTMELQQKLFPNDREHIRRKKNTAAPWISSPETSGRKSSGCFWNTNPLPILY